MVRGNIYDMPVTPDRYRTICMVADDGVLLVEAKVHERAEEPDLIPILRNWLERVREKERAELRGHLSLVRLDGDARAS